MVYTTSGELVKYDRDMPVPGGILFDSMKEARRYVELLAMLKRGEITCLERQRRIKIRVNGVVVCAYVADFVYMVGGRRVVEDVKSPRTRLLPVYVLKKKLLKAALGIEICEV